MFIELALAFYNKGGSSHFRKETHLLANKYRSNLIWLGRKHNRKGRVFIKKINRPQARKEVRYTKFKFGHYSFFQMQYLSGFKEPYRVSYYKRAFSVYGLRNAMRFSYNRFPFLPKVVYEKRKRERQKRLEKLRVLNEQGVNVGKTRQLHVKTVYDDKVCRDGSTALRSFWAKPSPTKEDVIRCEKKLKKKYDVLFSTKRASKRGVSKNLRRSKSSNVFFLKRKGF